MTVRQPRYSKAEFALRGDRRDETEVRSLFGRRKSWENRGD